MLELDDVQAGYGDTTVLFGVSMSVPAGGVLTLLGRNGAGKSSTFRAIMRVIRVGGGTIRFEGVDLAGLAPHEIARRGIGYVPEDRRIFAPLTVEENLRVTRPFGCKASPWSLADVYGLFPKLAALAGRRGGLLSGGEQQMLCIARTLMGGPRLLLLDEPSEGLAPVVVHALRDQIALLRAKGLTIVLAEQNLGFAEAVGERVTIIDRGRTEFAGTFADIRASDDLRDRFLFVGRRDESVVPA